MKNFKQIFTKQNLDGRPWIVWIWNLTISRQEMINQLNTLIAQGFAGIIIRPGRDMSPAYLSEEFFNLFKIVLDAAKEHGIGVRISYDCSLPWSDCFRAFLDQNEKLRARTIALRDTQTRQEGELFEYSCENPEGTILLAARVKDQEVILTDVKELSFSGTAVSWKVPQGEWRIYILKMEYAHDLAGDYMPNLYNSRTAQLYIQTVLNVFKTRFSKFVGTTFKGFLTEMPSFRPADGALPWDDDLVVKFRTKYKKDLLKYFPALFHNAAEAGRIRNQIYRYLDESMYERFAFTLEMWAKNSKLSQWVLCPERSLQRSNHPLLDGDFHTHEELPLCGIQSLDGAEESYAMFRAMTDCNANEYHRGTLAILGRNAVGAAATPQSLKDEILLSYIGGASPLMIDGCFSALDQRGYVKTPHNPVWYPYLGNYFKPLCDYAGVVYEVLKNVSFSRPVAILSPSGAIRATYLPSDAESSRAGIQMLRRSIDALVVQNLDFDILSEEYVTSCTIKQEGQFFKPERKGKAPYAALLVPYAPLISRSSLVFLEKLVGRGGKVIFVNEIPRGTYEDGANLKVAHRIEKLLNPKRSGSRVIPIEELDRSLADVPSRIKITSHDQSRPDIICADGVEEDTSYYVIHNRSDRQESMVRVEVPQDKHLAWVDCENGSITEIPDISRENSVCRFSLRLMPRRTVLIVGSQASIVTQPSKQAKPVVSPFASLHRNYRIVLKSQWSFEPQTLNALPISNWSLRIGLSRESGGFSHFYESQFQVGTLPSECYCAIPNLGNNHFRVNGEGQIEVTVNGTRVDRPLVPTGAAPEGQLPTPGTPLPVSFIVPQDQINTRYLFGYPVTLYNIKDLLVKGFNRFSVRTSGVVIDPQTIQYPPLLLGNFSITRGQSGWVIDKPGSVVGIDSWTRYGYPYLSGVGVYRQMFEIPHQYSRLILRMTRVSGVVDIKINGKDVGKFLWQPIEADITALCEPRRNELVVTVANTVDNILRLNGRPSGILGDGHIDVS